MASTRARFNFTGLAVIVAIIAVWELIVASGIANIQYLPAPHEIAAALAELAADGQLLTDLLHTLSVLLQAWTIAVVLGTLAGLAVGRFAAVRWMFGSTIDIFRSLPVVALVPVVLLMFGLTRESEVWVAAFGALWPMLVNVAGAVNQIHPRLGDVAASFGLSSFAYMRKIMLPALLPSIIVGARLALGLSLVLVIVAEMVGNPAGLGYGLVRWQFALRPDAMWSYLVVVGFLGLVLNWIFLKLLAITPGTRGAAL